MKEELEAREQIVCHARSLFERGLTAGASGNISVRLADGTFLVTPTGKSFGFLVPPEISRVSADFIHLNGLEPTKELPIHQAFYETRPTTGSVVHLHSTYAVAMSLLPDVDAENVLAPLTPYSIMRLGRVKRLPFYVPGDPALGSAIRALGGRRAAVLLANHGPVVAAETLDAAVFAMEELEETARLTLLLHGLSPRALSPDQVAAVVSRFNVEWD